MNAILRAIGYAFVMVRIAPIGLLAAGLLWLAFAKEKSSAVARTINGVLGIAALAIFVWLMRGLF